MKQQFWLTPDQLALNVECLKCIRLQLNNDRLSDGAVRMAVYYTRDRVSDLLRIFAPEENT